MFLDRCRSWPSEKHMREALLDAGFDPSKTAIHCMDTYVTISDVECLAQLAFGYLARLAPGG
jgi:hypothetical protein